MGVPTSKGSKYNPDYKRTRRVTFVPEIKMHYHAKVGKLRCGVCLRQTERLEGQNRDSGTYSCMCGNLIQDTCVLLDRVERKNYSTKGAEQLVFHTEKKRCLVHTTNKNQLQVIKDLVVRGKPMAVCKLPVPEPTLLNLGQEGISECSENC